MLIFLKISMRKKTLSRQSKLLARAAEQAPAPIMITDAQANIEYVNPRFTELSGYSKKELMGQNPRILASGKTPRQTYEELWKTILSGKVWQGELCNRRKNGEIFWESLVVSTLKDNQNRITHFIGIWQDTTQRKLTEEELLVRSREFETQSRTDDLTGQYNRRHILVELEKEVERALRYGRRLSGMMVDIDDFKNINDQYGHLVGDRVIKAFAGVLERSIRKVDILGRYGGDEFLIILPEATADVARLVAQRIQKNLADYQRNVLGELSPFTASIGLRSFEAIKEVDKTIFIEKIDQALLKAKRAGKNTISMRLVGKWASGGRSHLKKENKIKGQIKEIIDRLLKEIEEEDIGISLLTMHYRSRGELQFFGEDDRRRVIEILGKLSKDSKRHKKLLAVVIQHLAQKLL